jgi:hypothetical protein
MVGGETPRGGFTALESIVEDVIGFNFRSLRTLGDLFVRPNQVFRAYMRRHQTRYTPALRLWLSLTVIMAILSYFFGGQDDLIRKVIAKWPDAQREAFMAQIGGNMDGFAEAYGQVFATLQPFIIGLGMIIPVLVMAGFSRGAGWIARINLTYAVLNAGSIFGLLAFPLVVQNSDLGLWTLLPITFLYWLTFFRGAPGVLGTSLTGRIVKASVFTLVTLIMVLISDVLTVAASMLYAINTTPG